MFFQTSEVTIWEGIVIPKVLQKVKLRVLVLQKYNTNLHKQRRHEKFDKK